MKKLISLENVSYTYLGQSKPAIRNISFSIKRGEHVAIVGGNGSGKSTLARHLNALLLPSEGIVRIDGKKTDEKLHLKEIRRKIGMVFQHPEDQIIGATVEEDIAFGLENIATPTIDIIKKIENILHVVGLENYRRQPSFMLSGGQIQKLCLASVLVMNPACVIFDEATAMLDPQSRNRIYDAINKMHDEGITVITITHDMEEAAMADRLLVMHDGHLVADVVPREFFSNEDMVKKYLLSLPPITEIANMIQMKNRFNHKTILTMNEFEELLEKYKSFRYIGSFSQQDNLKKKSIVSVDNVSYSYFPNSALERKILDDVSFSIKENSIHGLLGATGTGKTTLMQHLNGLILPQAGTVEVLGKKTSEENFDFKELRKQVGFVFQYTSHQLFENYVGDEIAFGLRAFDNTENIREKVKNAMNLVGLDFEAFVNRQTFSLSGGERKKVALASILVSNPSILLFDEPTVGLDPASQKLLMKMLVDYRNQHNKTILISSHNTNLIAEYTDEATVIGKNKSVFSSTIDSFFESTEKIENYGLNIPTSIQAKDHLISVGWNIPTKITKKKDLIYAIKEAH